jgi:hypothetical protein
MSLETSGTVISGSQPADALMDALERWLFARLLPTATDNYRNQADAQLRAALREMIRREMANHVA